ncbi:IclR family transcriptional regulator [Pimelobacter simplex]|nr:IclR family transcriptional regulator [Pimelobacter simplex]
MDELAGEGHRKVTLLRAVDRSLSIIGTFDDGHARQTLSEISRRAGLPVSTTYRIVERLRVWGALERDEERRYHIGLRLWEVATLAPRSMTLQRVAHPFMIDLYKITSCSIHLAIREGHETVFIERIENPRQILSTRASGGPRVGFRHPMHTTAVGKVLLAHIEDGVREEILADLPADGDGGVDLPTLRHELVNVRRQGYALSGPDLSPDYMAVAAPVTAGGVVIAALSVIVRSGAGEQGAADLVRVAAGGISRAMKQQV